MCDRESDILFIKHESIFQCHTHICCTYRVFHCMVIYFNILHCAHMLHISDIDTTPVSTRNQRPMPPSRGCAAK